MPRNFFSISDSEIISDDEGSELPSLDAARGYAIEAARDLLAEDVRQGKLPLSMSFIVTDEGGSVVLVLPFKDAVEIF